MTGQFAVIRGGEAAEAGETGRIVGGRYCLEERLGEGTLGAVHRAVHLGLEKAFAVKLLKTAGVPDPTLRARFRVETLALGRLRHPHIAPSIRRFAPL